MCVSVCVCVRADAAARGGAAGRARPAALHQLAVGVVLPRCPVGDRDLVPDCQGGSPVGTGCPYGVGGVLHSAVPSVRKDAN